jgi:hypothetical protein
MSAAFHASLIGLSCSAPQCRRRGLAGALRSPGRTGMPVRVVLSAADRPRPARRARNLRPRRSWICERLPAGQRGKAAVGLAFGWMPVSAEMIDVLSPSASRASAARSIRRSGRSRARRERRTARATPTPGGRVRSVGWRYRHRSDGRRVRLLRRAPSSGRHRQGYILRSARRARYHGAPALLRPATSSPATPPGRAGWEVRATTRTGLA